LTYFYYSLRGKNNVFVDHKLPAAQVNFTPNPRFNQNYYITLSELVSAAGPTWGPGTPNHIGARVQLMHTDLKLDMWRKHLIGYQDIELCQYLEFGFPLGQEPSQKAAKSPQAAGLALRVSRNPAKAAKIVFWLPDKDFSALTW
jgi:hypothetical protein